MTGVTVQEQRFPYFFVGTFIEAPRLPEPRKYTLKFPYFFVGTFIEASCTIPQMVI